MTDTATAPTPAPRRARGRAAGPSAPPVPRLPQVQRRRRLGLAGLAVVLTVGFGALSGALVLRSGDREAVVTVVNPVPAGAQIERGDLGVVDIAVDGLPTVPASRLPSLVGQFAVVPLISGTVLSPVALAEEALPGAGQAVVGLQLGGGQLPSDGLRSGDVLRVVRIPSGNGTDAAPDADLVLVQRAVVLQSSVDAVNGATSVSVLVDESEATALTVAAARGEVAVARVEKAE